MSARSIGEIVRPLVMQAVGLARLQQFLDCFDAGEREQWIADFEQGQTVSEAEAALLREHNAEELA